MATNPIPGFDLAEIDQTKRQDRWQDAVSRYLMPMSVRLDHAEAGPLVDGFVRHQMLGDLSLAEWDSPASLGVRRRHDRAGGDAVFLFFAACGTERMQHGDSQSILHRGMTLVCRSDKQIRFATSEGLRKRTLTIPFSLFDGPYIDRYVRDGQAFEESRPVVGLLRSFLTQVWTRIPDMDHVELEATRNSVLALVLGMMRAADTVAEDTDLLPALRAQIDRWIDERLPYGPIQVADAAAAHHVSTRTVQRAFAADGLTFGAKLRGRRLEHARQDLVQTTFPISEIAHRWGYFDTSHFGREFRRQFDCSPRDYREVHGRPCRNGARDTDE
jgi:AraC family transcriptional activator of tynA and feaB